MPQIKPGEGVGDIRLGHTPSDVEHLLGRPSRITNLPQYDETEWDYGDLGIYVSFSTGGSPAVTEIAINSRAARLFNADVIGISENALHELFATENITLELSDWSDPDGAAKFFVAHEQGLFIATEFGEVSCVICGPKL